jgi:hypothetical protein
MSFIEQLYDIAAGEIRGALFGLPGLIHDLHRVFGSSAQLYLERRKSAMQIKI